MINKKIAYTVGIAGILASATGLYEWSNKDLLNDLSHTSATADRKFFALEEKKSGDISLMVSNHHEKFEATEWFSLASLEYLKITSRYVTGFLMDKGYGPENKGKYTRVYTSTLGIRG